MRRLLRENAPVPAHVATATRRRDHVSYCFAQMLRFAALAEAGAEPFRHAQFGLQLGRLQELLGGAGGKALWWCAFEPLLLASDWAGLRELTSRYAALFADDLRS